ncbi:N-acetyldiaminopimelate deacetylase [Gracilibacillus ureilyticus]|uniref:N-acetyldiaminopimelate deacetylase n=1 Tax=Gracilibacillus ureilyticus TaxID=531814 RepID=A0A1H9TLX3_9BACI|nr:N-acetyldiaminopimelate deacetylase [Gracilibacillus ureilyticus]SER97919.1 N-acetyldiaminopimelate deacetylase [Gracilibacillus ureilyticus]
MNKEELIKIRRDLHQIPELGFREFKTQEYLLATIMQMNRTNIHITKWETGLFVFVKGLNPKRTIAYRTDIDGLPIVEETGLPFGSVHRENMHACGHDLHMTIALGALDEISSNPINDNVLFIFQPAEEGPGGAEPILKSDTFKQWEIDKIFALHIAPELPVGTVSSREGILFANTSELFIDFKGKGGHAAYPHLTRDMIVTASTFVTQLQHIISRKVDPLDSGVITIGKMTAGTVQNIIAEKARLEGTIRTLQPETMSIIKTELENMIAGFQIAYDCEITTDYGSMYYQVYNHGQCVSEFREIMKDAGIHYTEANSAMTGEDFGYFLKDTPGFMFWLGVESDYGLHHSKLNPNEDAIIVGVKAVTDTLRKMK